MRRVLALLLIAVLLAIPSTGPAAASAEAPAPAAIDPLLTAALAESGSAEVIVTFHGDGPPTDDQVALLQSLGVGGGVTLRALPMAGAILSASQVQALAARPEVRSLYLNQRLMLENEGATALTGVDRLRADGNLTALNGGLPVSGKGIGVLVNDSGVDGTHADHQLGRNLVQNVAAQANLHGLVSLLPITYVEDVPNTDSTGGHGTHVAGIVGATGARSGGKYEGVAPGASLIGYGTGAALAILDTLGGFDYAITHQAEYGIRVITNSWGSTGDTGTAFDPNNPINIATKKAFDRNIVVVFSAGNSGPAQGSITGNYKKAPWVIAVAAGDKQGRMAGFSSRGVPSRGGSVTVDGQTYTWEDRPTVTAPGVKIISTRVIAPVSSLGPTDDAALIEPAYLPYYTTMSGTSMAAPHVAGVVALMLEANPALTPLQVKQILQETATNIPGVEPWEGGAGYVNAYAAVDKAFTMRAYGSTVNMARTFNSNALFTATHSDFAVTYDPVAGRSGPMPFTVPAGTAQLTAKAKAAGLLGETGNPLNLVLTAPDGTRYSSGVSVLFVLYPDRTVVVTDPQPGNWTLEMRGLNSVGLPETVGGTITLSQDAGYSGLDDIDGHPAATAIKLAVARRLVDGDSEKRFRPDENLSRRDLAQYLVMGVGVRQYLPAVGTTFADVRTADQPFAEAVAARGAAMRDTAHTARGVMLPAETGGFSPNKAVRRAELAYSMVQALGLEAEALARNSGEVTVAYNGSRIAIADADEIPAELRGYVQLALDLNIMNAYFSLTQGPFDLQPTVHATFKPQQKVTRAEYATAAVRFYSAYLIQ